MAVETGSSPRAAGVRSKLFTPRPTKPYIHPYLAGALLGVVLFAAFFLTGNGLGALGGLNNIIGFIEDLVAPNHMDRVPYLVKIAGGDKNPLDSWLVFMVLGTLLGGFVSGWFNGRLKVETVRGPHITVRTRWFMAFLGGAIMGYGARFRTAALPGRPSPAARCSRSGRGLSCSPSSAAPMHWPTFCASSGIRLAPAQEALWRPFPRLFRHISATGASISSIC